MDLIDRQAAIDAVISLCDDCDSGYCGSCRVNYPGEKDARKALEDLPSAEPEIIRCKDCKHWTQSTGKMKGYGLGRCDFHDADLVTCNGFCYWAEGRTDG